MMSYRAIRRANSEFVLFLSRTQSEHVRVLWLMVKLRFDSSVGRGDLITPIGVGRVIKGRHPYIETCVEDSHTDASGA